MDRSLSSSHRYPLADAQSGWRIRRSGWFPHCLALLSTACLQSSEAEYPNVQCPKPDALRPSEDPSIPDVIPALPPREDPATSAPTNDATAEGELDYPPPDLAPSVPPAPPVTELPATDHALFTGAESSSSSPEVIAALPLVYLPTPVAHRLLAIDAQQPRYKVRIPKEYVVCGEQYLSQVGICVNEGGTVSSVKILQPSLPLIDMQLPKVLALWTFRPYLVEGRPTAFCYPLNYRVH